MRGRFFVCASLYAFQGNEERKKRWDKMKWRKKIPSGYFVCVCDLGEIKNLPGGRRRSAFSRSTFWHNFKFESAETQSTSSTQTTFEGWILHKHAKEAEHRKRKWNEMKLTTIGAAVEGSWTSGKLGIIKARQENREKRRRGSGSNGDSGRERLQEDVSSLPGHFLLLLSSFSPSGSAPMPRREAAEANLLPAATARYKWV